MLPKNSRKRLGRKGVADTLESACYQLATMSTFSLFKTDILRKQWKSALFFLL